MTPPLVDRCIELMEERVPRPASPTGTTSRTPSLARRAAFRRTLERGSTLLENKLADLADGATLAGDVAFDLYETYGFPLEVTQEITAERGIEVDVDGLRSGAGRAAQEISGGKTSKESLYADLSDFQSVLDRFGPTEFVGREEFETKATVVAVVPGATARSRSCSTARPFYAEAGGQVGDTGTITTDTGTAEVLDTNYALPGLHRHVARIVDGEIIAGQEATAAIDVARRDAIRRNHTGTHILHWALRQVLGDHVKQQGSLVAPDRLRFDFSHYEPVTAEQIQAIEDLANAEILANDPVHHYETTKAQRRRTRRDRVLRRQVRRHRARARSGPALDRAVRWHARARPRRHRSGQDRVGRSRSDRTCVASRRSRHRSDRAASRRGALLDSVAQVLNVPREDLVDGVRKRLDEIKGLRDEVKTLRARPPPAGPPSSRRSAVDGVVVARVDGVDRDGLRDLALAVRDQPGIRAVVLGRRPKAAERRSSRGRPTTAGSTRRRSSPTRRRPSRAAAARDPCCARGRGQGSEWSGRRGRQARAAAARGVGGAPARR